MVQSFSNIVWVRLKFCKHIHNGYRRNNRARKCETRRSIRYRNRKIFKMHKKWDKYKISEIILGETKQANLWVKINNFAIVKKQQKTSKKQKQSYYIPLTKNDRLESLTNQRFSAIYEWSSERWKLSASCIGLFHAHIWLFFDASLFRNWDIHYFRKRRANIEGQPPHPVLVFPWDQYLTKMSQDKRRSDQITLQGIIAHLYNEHICGESTPLSPRGLMDINEENGIQTLILSYFVEEQGDHYICLWQNTNLDDSMIDFSLHKQSGYDFENIDQENVEQSVTANI